MASTSEPVGADALTRSADLATPMAIRVAATLRLGDHINAGRCSAEGIAAEVSLDVDALERLMRHLVSAGVLTRDADGCYGLTESGAAIADDHPSGLRRVLDMEGPLGRSDLAFVELLETVRSGANAFERRHGRGFWEDLAADAERQASFDAIMARHVTAWAQAIVPAYDWASLGHVIDVGGGDGSLLIALLREHLELRGSVLEQPATAMTARRNLATSGLGDRCDVIEGSFFEALPGGADGYLLSAILHDWDDPHAIAILRRCADAAGRIGRVLVVERTGPGGEAPSTRMDLGLLVSMGGRQRGVRANVALAADAGLRPEAVHAAGDLSIIELVAG